MTQNDLQPKANKPQPASSRTGQRLPWRPLIWGVVAVLAIVGGWRLIQIVTAPPPAAPGSPAAGQVAGATLTPLASETPIAFPTPDPAFVSAPASTPAPGAAGRPVEPPATPTLAADEALARVTPAAGQVGWVGSEEARGNHFGNSFLHAGTVQDQIFHGAIQFDLSRLPRGAPIRYAALSLTGLNDERLNRAGSGAWEVRWLDPQVNADWSRKNFQDIHNAPVLQSILPPLGQANLAPLATNQFVFNGDQLGLLQQALVDGKASIAFRLDGPQGGGDDFFSWDSGYGPATRGSGPALLVVTGPAPATPPPLPTQDYVVVTSTPTPANVLTAAAIVEQATAQATQIGTATPTPPNLVTAMPAAANEATADAQRLLAGLPPVVTNTPTPANDTQATTMARYATAVALTTGTYTPTPPNLITATPTATFVVVTNTPTPASAAAALAQAIAQATRVALEGPPTALPPWVTTATPQAVIVGQTATPANAATAEYLRVYPTIAALTIGTLTPTPPNLVTATFTPAPTSLPLLVPLTFLSPTPTPTIPPSSIPASLRGKIIFWSDRLGDPKLFVMDPACVNSPDGCGGAVQFWLTRDYPHRLGWEEESFAPDRRKQLLVKSNVNKILQIAQRDLDFDVVNNLTTFEKGSSFDPAWSPRGDKIAFVSTETGNDELYVMNADGTNPQRLTFNSWEWDKHPTWSPDGNQIIFYSNRESGRRQLWIMNADGSDQRTVLDSPYNDWDPVWIK